MQVVKLKVSCEDSIKLMNSHHHRRFRDAIQRNWIVVEDKGVRIQCVFWLFCWGMTGMGSDSAKGEAIQLFNQLFPFNFAEFRAVVKHEYARRARYAKTENLEPEFIIISKNIQNNRLKNK